MATTKSNYGETMAEDYCDTIAEGDHSEINGRDLPDQGTDSGLDVSPYGADIGPSATNRLGSLKDSSTSDTPDDETIRAETIVSGSGGHDTFSTGSGFDAESGQAKGDRLIPRADDIHS